VARGSSSASARVKLLLDEMLSPEIAAQLRRVGHDVEAIAGSDLAGIGDEDVLDLARAQLRTVVTNNIGDFRRLHGARVGRGSPGHFGIVLVPSSIRRRASDVGILAAALELMLAEYPRDDALIGTELWLSRPGA
jgi:predicted nuclease of predicted toxin-antitoxin system